MKFFREINVLSYITLLVQDFRQQKNQPLPIQRSRPSVYSQEPKTTKKFQFSRWLFQKIPFLYFFLHKSWIWRTLGHVMNIFSYWHFYNASKEYFWSKNKFKFHAPVKKCHFGNFSIFPGMLNQKRLVFLLSKILYKQCDKGSF